VTAGSKIVQVRRRSGSYDPGVTAFSLFQAPIGACGIAWGPRGVAAVQLPDRTEAGLRARFIRRFPGAEEAPPPEEIRRAQEAIVSVMRGADCDLGDIVLDMEGLPPFHKRVYREARRIRPGKTVSYGELAARLGARPLARAVGQALGSNPYPIVVPCHRVLAAGGRMGGFSAPGGVETKLRLLALEGAILC
jgi:methylated-DNA-[protein]-cysteine S-methyltransferase